MAGKLIEIHPFFFRQLVGDHRVPRRLILGPGVEDHEGRRETDSLHLFGNLASVGVRNEDHSIIPGSVFRGIR